MNTNTKEGWQDNPYMVIEGDFVGVDGKYFKIRCRAASETEANAFSEMYPDILWAMRGVGEDDNDAWQKVYHKGGCVSEWQQGEIAWPPLRGKHTPPKVGA